MRKQSHLAMDRPSCRRVSPFKQCFWLPCETTWLISWDKWVDIPTKVCHPWPCAAQLGAGSNKRFPPWPVDVSETLLRGWSKVVLRKPWQNKSTISGLIISASVSELQQLPTIDPHFIRQSDHFDPFCMFQIPQFPSLSIGSIPYMQWWNDPYSSQVIPRTTQKAGLHSSYGWPMEFERTRGSKFSGYPLAASWFKLFKPCKPSKRHHGVAQATWWRLHRGRS